MQIGSTLIVRRHLRAGLASCAVLFGALLLVPQEVLAQKQSKSSSSSKAGSSKSSARSSSGSKSPSVRSSGSRSSSRSSSARSRSSSTSRSKSVGSRSGSVSRSKPSSRPSSRPSVSNPRSSSRSGAAVRSPSTRSGSSRSGATRSGTASRPSLKPADISRPGGESDSRRHAIDIRDTKNRIDKIGRREGDPEYTHRPRHRRYPYPYYHPYRYYGGYFGGYHGYYGGFYRNYYGYYPWDFPYFFYGPFGYMYTPHAPGYHGGGGGGAYGDGLGGLDLNVKPKDAVVYINGDAIGTVDRYDGYPSYLWLEPGTHTISFYLEGYQTVTRQYTILADVVVSVKERLVPGTAVPPPEEVLLPEAEASEGTEPPTSHEAAGRLMLTVKPPDAAVYLDGHFLGIAGELSHLSTGMLVEPGEHVLELVRPGYHTEEVPLVVPPGEHIKLDLTLRER